MMGIRLRIGLGAVALWSTVGAAPTQASTTCVRIAGLKMNLS
jgi:hypothetical protein